MPAMNIKEYGSNFKINSVIPECKTSFNVSIEEDYLDISREKELVVDDSDYSIKTSKR